MGMKLVLVQSRNVKNVPLQTSSPTRSTHYTSYHVSFPKWWIKSQLVEGITQHHNLADSAITPFTTFTPLSLCSKSGSRMGLFNQRHCLLTVQSFDDRLEEIRLQDMTDCYFLDHCWKALWECEGISRSRAGSITLYCIPIFWRFADIANENHIPSSLH